MSHKQATSFVVTIAAAALLTGCGSSGAQLTAGSQTATSAGGASAPATSPTGTASTANYHPNINPSQFTDHITNTYLPLVPGTSHHYTGTRDGTPTSTLVTITNQRRTVMGVRCVVVQDVVTSNNTLVEKTTDWYAQDAAGNVWYFGENTAEYQNGVVVSTQGTWEAGVDHAQPGIVMPARPKVGKTYRQEFLPGVAEDIAKILSLHGTATVPAGTYHNLVVTFDKNPLDPTKIEHKWYAAGIGFVHAVLHQGGHTEITGLVK